LGEVVVARLEVSPSVHHICKSAADRRRLELVDVNLRTAGRQRVLEVILDRPEGGMSMDLITEVSQEISRALDDDDSIQGRYMLEVSSAGLERPLTRPADYRRFEGRDIQLRLREPLAGKKRFEGRIGGAGDESFELELADGGAVEIPFEAVARANLAVDWAQELAGIERDDARGNVASGDLNVASGGLVEGGR
jgi:ribosome maturation factor RimP